MALGLGFHIIVQIICPVSTWTDDEA